MKKYPDNKEYKRYKRLKRNEPINQGNRLFGSPKTSKSNKSYAEKYRIRDRHLESFVRANRYWKKWDRQ